MRHTYILLFIIGFLAAGCTRDNVVKQCCEPIPLQVQFGPPPKMYGTITIVPAQSVLISPDFLAYWNEAKASVIELSGGPRTLYELEIKYLTETQVRFTYKYTVATGALATAEVTYNYTYDSRGYLKLGFAARNGNARVLAPSLFPLQENYLERFTFKISWIEDKVPGSEGKQVGFFKEGQQDSFFCGTISK